MLQKRSMVMSLSRLKSENTDWLKKRFNETYLVYLQTF